MFIGKRVQDCRIIIFFYFNLCIYIKNKIYIYYSEIKILASQFLYFDKFILKFICRGKEF